MCVSVCLCIFTHMCIYTHMYICIRILIYTHTHNKATVAARGGNMGVRVLVCVC